jgi:hypothetical protein
MRPSRAEDHFGGQFGGQNAAWQCLCGPAQASVSRRPPSSGGIRPGHGSLRLFMVRRRSTVRFRKGALQVSGVFRACILDLFRGFSRAGRRSRVPAARIPAGHRPYRVQAGRLWRAAAGNRGARSSPIPAGIADASLSPRSGVRVERCRRCAALGAVLLWWPFSDVASSAWASRAGRRPRSVAGRSMGGQGWGN